MYKGTDARYVLFVTDKTSSTGQNGYMRLNGQFGYVYNNAPQKTGAHELGHGVFKLEHPWKAYQTTKGATDLLMDYSTGEELSHLDWKQVNDPAFKLYTFQGQSSGEFTDIQLTPEWEPFKFTGSSIYISGPVKSPNGAVHGIAMCKNDNCTEKENYFWINDGTKKGYYVNGKSSPLAITYLNQQEKDKNPAITLFWNYGSCGYNKTYSTSWNYIKDKKGFDLTKVTAANTISYKETVPCADGSGSSVSSDDMCVGKDVVAINQGYNNVLGVLDSNDKAVIVETIKNADDCSLRLLSYTQIEKLIKKLGYDSTIKDDQESAIVRLAASIKTEDFKTFYALLETNNNELIKNLVSHLQDRIVVYGGSNYTGFVSVLVQMFNKYPASIADRWPTDADGFAKRVINLNPVDYTKDTTSSPWIQTFTSKHNDGSYISGTGNIRINDVYTTTAYVNGNYGSVDKEEEITVVSPLTPVIIVPSKDKIPLIQSAIDGYDFGNANYIVPAILLKYNKDKIRNDYIEKSVMTALDLATIYASGGTALATKVTWVRRAWALAEVAGAVGNIAVTTQTINPESNLGKAINAYNLGMGIIGVKNVTVAGYKFVAALPENTKNLLQQNKGLRDLLVAKYTEWKTLTTNVDNLSSAEKQIVFEQEKAWKALGIWQQILDDMPVNFFDNANDVAATYDKFNKVSSALRGEIYNFYKQKKWDKIEQIFKENNLNGNWPPANGGYNIIDDVSITKGMKFDRFQDWFSLDKDGKPIFGGSFTSPIINSPYTYSQRALKFKEIENSLYYEIEILKDLPIKGQAADVIPWFGQPGNGKQIMFIFQPKGGEFNNLQDLIDKGYIKITIKKSPNGKYSEWEGKSFSNESVISTK
ncbi:TNT domain-containing protein [Chryseobacterium rhizoplanae]|uniref:TNT domain-containing protein n=1 Tax=Chryseobacterium rhizoplanae TaxID=1609531 RepID=UPI001CE2BD31|nr:TNT domain-containing protein [Chryseobacterium rhizoplanae]UCA61536.1 TNT domain-containing protein [Chryseobacterium rhizoplanae]